MATTGKLNGTLMLLYVDGTAISSTTSHSLSYEMATRDATTKDSQGYEEFWKVPEVGLLTLMAWRHLMIHIPTRN